MSQQRRRTKGRIALAAGAAALVAGIGWYALNTGDKEEKRVHVADLAGLTESAAVSKLSQSGVPFKIIRRRSSRVAPGIVMAANPTAVLDGQRRLVTLIVATR